MAAYADVVSLTNTILRLDDSSRISIDATSLQVLQFAYDVTVSLKNILRGLDADLGYMRSERMNALDEQAREAVRKFEDTLDSLLLNQIVLSQSDQETSLAADHDQGSSLIFSIHNSEQARLDILTIKGLATKMAEYYNELKSNPLPEDEDEEEEFSSEIDRISGGSKPRMVGFSQDINQLQFWVSKRRLSHPEFATYGRLTGLCGMAGVGKTTLAKEIFEHPSILSDFGCRAWVTVGQKYTRKRIIRRILAQVDPEKYTTVTKVGEYELAGHLKESLKDKDYLIVLDDVWDKEIFDGLQMCLPDPDKKDQGIVLLTTRLNDVAYKSGSPYMIKPRDDEASWDILREKVFGGERCPTQLVKAGRKIAENCEGLPLLIVEVAKLLSKADKTLEYWNEVAEERNSVFKDAHDQILEVLLPSYNHLHIEARAPFIYMGVYPKKYKISFSEIMSLWYAEGILPQSSFEGQEAFTTSCFHWLCRSNLIMVNIRTYILKNCTLHSVFWHLCYRVAGKHKFFHVLKKRADSLTEDIKGQRRLCIQHNVLFSIKDVYDSMMSISTARSLICTGPYHQYPVPLCFNSGLLKVLYALTIRFYEFPTEVEKLVLLRYLALTFDGKIPSSISKLWNLESLIVHRHFNIKSSRDPSYLPAEIWDMKELKFLQIMGTDLPNPCGAVLPNLLTLSDVSAESCTKCVFEGLPKLKELGVRIELTLDATEPLSCFDQISHVHTLESLKCVIGSPNLKSPQAPMKFFPSGLKRLSLSGFGYPWEDMRVIASLPNLEVLILRSYAFRGPMWEMRDGGLLGLQSHPTKDTEEYADTFQKLEFLSIKDTDLVHWRTTRASFPSLEQLTIKHCYKLEEIPLEFEYSRRLRQIELVDCSPAAVTCVEQLSKATKKSRNGFLSVAVRSSWDGRNIK